MSDHGHHHHQVGNLGGVFGRRSKLVKAIGDDLRALIVGLHPDTVEVPRNGDKAVAFGFGEKKLSETYCYLKPHTGYVNIRLQWGALLDDPNSLMEGAGKKLRHVKIHDQETARAAKTAQLVYLAIEERRTALAKSTAKKTTGARKSGASKKRTANKETA